MAVIYMSSTRSVPFFIEIRHEWRLLPDFVSKKLNDVHLAGKNWNSSVIKALLFTPRRSQEHSVLLDENNMLYHSKKVIIISRKPYIPLEWSKVEPFLFLVSLWRMKSCFFFRIHKKNENKLKNKNLRQIRDWFSKTQFFRIIKFGFFE